MVGAAVVVLAPGLGTTAAQAAPFVYVTNGLRGNVAQFDVGPGGALSPKSPATVPAGGAPFAVAVSPDGGSAYVANQLSDISQFDLGPGGALSPKSPAAVPVGGIPQALAVSPLPRVPTSKNQCKNSGWRSFAQFRNQGQCVAFVNTSRPVSHRPGP
jgi:DNA-binding beta-propeller fold protein YncE